LRGGAPLRVSGSKKRFKHRKAIPGDLISSDAELDHVDDRRVGFLARPDIEQISREELALHLGHLGYPCREYAYAWVLLPP